MLEAAGYTYPIFVLCIVLLYSCRGKNDDKERMMNMKGLEVLKKFKTGESAWLPLIDYAYSVIPPKNEYGEVNIGWNAGILENNRPFFRCAGQQTE